MAGDATLGETCNRRAAGPLRCVCGVRLTQRAATMSLASVRARSMRRRFAHDRTPVCVFVIAGHSATVDRRLVAHAVVALLGNVFFSSFASWGLELLGLTGVVVLTMLGWTWRQRSQPAAPPAE